MALPTTPTDSWPQSLDVPSRLFGRGSVGPISKSDDRQGYSPTPTPGSVDELVRDGLLALLPAVALAVCVGWFAIPVTPTPIVVGVLGTLLLELLLATRTETVRRYWRKSIVQVGAVGVLAVGIWLGWTTLGGRVLVVALAGLVTYLLLVGGVLADVIPPTSEWSE